MSNTSCAAMKPFLALFLLANVLLSCQKKEAKTERNAATSTVVKASDLYSKVYYLSTSLNTEKCTAENAGCDCCDGKIVFFDGNRFISDYYCLPEEEFTSGTFLIKQDKLILQYDKYGAVLEPVDENDPESKDTLRIENTPRTTLELSIFTCQKKILFKSRSEYYSEHSTIKFNEAVTAYKKSGVWNLLEGED